jgi:hypothetical protein
MSTPWNIDQLRALEEWSKNRTVTCLPLNEGESVHSSDGECCMCLGESEQYLFDRGLHPTQIASKGVAR